MNAPEAQRVNIQRQVQAEAMGKLVMENTDLRTQLIQTQQVAQRAIARVAELEAKYEPKPKPGETPPAAAAAPSDIQPAPAATVLPMKGKRKGGERPDNEGDKD